MSLLIKYNGKTIATLEKGQIVTLACEDKKMLSDVMVYTDLVTLGVRLITADGYVLTDANGIYITVKESE